MIFRETGLPGAFIVEPELHRDERGFFARTWCRREFEAHGLDGELAQCNLSWNRARGTLRGLHYQAAPDAEAKLVRCASGAMFDVIADVRPGSPTCGEHFGVELTASNHLMLYVPKGFAHGFLTLEDDTAVFYQMSNFYAPQSARGVRWDDPDLGIAWPMEPVVMSEKDRGLPNLVRS